LFFSFNLPIVITINLPNHPYISLRIPLHRSSYYRTKLGSGDYYGDPINIPANTKVLKVLLDLIHQRRLPALLIWSIRDPLRKLCDDLGCTSISERALFGMHECVEKDPWSVFCLTSQPGNVGLATSALRTMADKSDTQHPKVTKLTPELAAHVTLPYLLGFTAAI